MDERLAEDDAINQISFVTDNLEASLAWFGDLTGKTPSAIAHSADPEIARATYHGAPARLGCRIAFFRFSNIEVEFVEPGPERSTWRDMLDAKGPGCHHIAFKTRNMGRRSAYLAGKRLPEVQRGEFVDGGGGRYAYYDTAPQLGIQLELLEWDNDREPNA